MADPFNSWLAGSTVPEEPNNVLPFPAPEKKKEEVDPFNNWLQGSDPSVTLDSAVGSNPDEVAKNKALADQSGLPVPTVEADPAEVQKLVRKQQIDNLIKDAPITRQWLSNPDNANVAHDSVEGVSELERIWGQVKEIGTGVQDAARALGAGVMNVPIGVEYLAKAVEENIGMDTSQADIEINALRDLQSWIRGEQNVLFPSVSGGFESAGTSLAALVTRNPSTALTVMGGTTGGLSYGQAREAGTSPFKSLLYGAAQGATEVLTEKIPVDRLFRGLRAGDGFFKLVRDQLLIENATEQVATAVQDMNEWLFLHPEKTIGEYLKERPNAALDTAIGTTVGTIFQTSVSHISTQLLAQTQKADDGQKFKEKLDKTQETLVNMPVTQRAPNVAVDALAKTMHDTEVFMSVDGITELANKLELSPVDLAQQMGIRQQFEKEYLRGGDIRLSPEQLGQLMLSENWNLLSEHIRETEDAFTAREAEEFEKTGLKDAIEGALAPTAEGITVYHGSPQGKFEEFDLNFKGTGEGGAAFGHGIYVAEVEATARHYKDLISDIDLSNLPKDIEAKYGKQLDEVTQKLDALYNEFANIPKNELNDVQYAEAAGPLFEQKDKIRVAIEAEMKARLGFLYQAKLNVKEDELLLWDKPIEQQSAKVKALIENTPHLKEYLDQLVNQDGSSIYNYLAGPQVLGSQEEASNWLAQHGIVGAKYLDALSRDKGEGTSNYVIYDPSRIKIIKRNGIPVGQAEIDVTAVEKDIGTDGLFQTSEEAGMTATEYMFYLASLKKAHDAAVNRQNEKLLKDAQRKVNKEYKALRKDMRESVRESLTNSPIYQVINSIQKDRLDRSALIALLGNEKALAQLPTQASGRKIYTNKDETGGLDPSVVAELNGFPSAFDMVYAIATAKPFEQAVEETTDQMMKRSYPDLSNEKARLDEALESLHNDYTGEVLVQELNRLRELAAEKKANKTANKEQATKQKNPRTDAQKQAVIVRQLKLKVLKNAIKKQLLSTPLKDIKVGRFVKTAKEQGKLAGKLLRKGDIEGAIDAKFKQLVNFTMAQQAYKIRAEVDKQNAYLNKFNTKQPPKIGLDFINIAKQLIGNYNLGPRLSSKNRQRIQDWVKKQEAAGALFQIPARLQADQKKHWQDLSLDEWRQLVDAVKNVEAQGRNKKLLGKIGKEVEFAQTKLSLMSTVNGISDTFRAAWKKQGKVDRTRDRAAANLAYVDSALVKVENLVRFLDGGSAGAWYKALFQPTAEAQTEQLDMLTKDVVPLVQQINKWPKVNKQRLEKKVFVAPLQQEMAYSELLVLALNSGNASNLEKVIEGHNSTLPKNPINGSPEGFLWTYQGIIDAMALLSPVEANWVQSVWDYLESLRPAVEAVYEAENGTPAQKIEVKPITIGGIKVKGGYFPMMYQYAPAHENALGALQDPFIRAAVYSGMTKERTGFVAPVDLNLQNLLPAIERNIHFITHYRAVRDTNRILQDNDLVNAIRNKLGEEYVQELKNWSEAVASGNMMGHSPTYVDKTVEFFRRGLTASILGLSWTTGVSQLFGYASSVAVLGRGVKGEAFSSKDGTKYMMLGAWKYLTEKNTVKQAKLLSGELRHRIANTDRELGDALKKARNRYGATGQIATAYNWWNKMALTVISGIQTYSVDIPTWIGAFNQALDNGLSTEDAVQHADSVLRTSQGTGHIKDLSAIQRKKGVMRALTMFSTYSLVLYNMERESVLAGKKFPISSFSRMLWAITIPAMMDVLLRGDAPDDDEETWIGWFSKKNAAYAARAVPLIGTGIASWMEGHDYRASPLEAVPINANRALSALDNWLIEGEDFDAKTAERLLLGLGTALGVGGTTQAGRLLDALATDDPSLQDYLLGVKAENE